MIRIDTTQTHSRELTHHYNGRSRTIALIGKGDAAASTWALHELLTAGSTAFRDGGQPTLRAPGDWPVTCAVLRSPRCHGEAIREALNAAVGWCLTGEGAAR